MFPRLSGIKKTNRKVGKLTNRRGGQSSNFFTDMTQVKWCPRFPVSSHSLSLRHGNESEDDGKKAISDSFFNLKQNWANFSFTLEHKQVLIWRMRTSVRNHPLQTTTIRQW
ncbi:hypothetical protein TNCV_415021 [Trichonephila clavipes]|nr:hypothetical protein TNCV_415021 [Trichonephila clavipes]